MLVYENFIKIISKIKNAHNIFMEEIEKLSKELNNIEKSILDNHAKRTAKELKQFIKTKRKIALLSELQKNINLKEQFNTPIVKNDFENNG